MDGADLQHGPSHSAESAAIKYKSYWERRIALLNAQRPDAQNTCLKSVHVYFNGFTDHLSSYHLKKLIELHGGACTPHPSRGVTHIVCTSLCASKANKVIEHRTKVPVVHPDWVIACVEAQRVVSTAPYLIRFDKSTPRLTDMFAAAAPAAATPAASAASVTSHADTAKENLRAGRRRAATEVCSVDTVARADRAEKRIALGGIDDPAVKPPHTPSAEGRLRFAR